MSKFSFTRMVKNGAYRFAKISLAAAFTVISVQSTSAYTVPRYASVVIDVNSGRTLQAQNATKLRYPASLTKIMTLYMLFEELESGRVKKWTKMPVSARAAGQEPSKLGLRKGSWISVDNAIKALVTKSANDVAVVVAEYLGGTEYKFAKKMTSRARSIGMRNTTFKNASGLPNKYQLTTAKDMAILGIKIQSRFPSYYNYFKTKTFKYKGRTYGNHNKLLGRYNGVDGIKTGYTRASGFNLVSSVKRGNKNVVAVIIGARSGASRNAAMVKLLDRAMPHLIAKKRVSKPTKHLAMKPPKPVKKPVFKPAPVQVANVVTAPKAVVATAAPKVASNKTRLTARMPIMPKMIASNKPISQVAIANAKSAAKVAAAPKAPAATTKNKDQSRVGKPANQALTPIAYAPKMVRKGKGKLSSQGQKVIEIASRKFKLGITPKAKAQPVTQQVVMPVVVAKAEPQFKDEWAVQVGAYNNADQARQRLDELSKIVSPFDAKYHIPSVKKGNKSIYRARFADLSKKYAKSACSAIKKKGYQCLALKNN